MQGERALRSRGSKNTKHCGRPHPHANLLLQRLFQLAVLCSTPLVHECAFADLRERKRDKYGTSRTKYDYKWIVDSGATKSCCNDLSKFKSIDRSKQIPVKTYGGGIIFAQGIGTVEITVCTNSGDERKILLRNVLYCPDAPCNLISTRRLWKDNKIKTVFGSHSYLKTEDKHKITIPDTNHEYELFVGLATDRVPSLDLLHRRFGHCSYRRLKQAIAFSKGVPPIQLFKEQFAHHRTRKHKCNACTEGSSSRARVSRHTADKKPDQQFGDVVSSDTCDFGIESVDGFRYAVCFVDRATGTVHVEYLKCKDSDSVLAALRAFQRKYEASLHEGVVRRWHTDNGTEFMSASITEFCNELCIRHSQSEPYFPEYNGQSERTWGLLLRQIRTTLLESNLDNTFWTYACKQAVNCRNLLPTKSTPTGCSPYEARTGKQPDLSLLRVFGCKCFFHLPRRDHKTKLDPTTVEAVNLGIDSDRRAYYLYIPSLNRITSAMPLRFDEDEFLSTADGKPGIPEATDQKKIKVRVGLRIQYDDSDPDPRNATLDSNAAPHEARGGAKPGFTTTPLVAEPILPEHDLATLPIAPAVPITGPRNDPALVQNDQWKEGKCPNTECTLPKGHKGLCSHMQRGGDYVHGPNVKPPSSRLRSRESAKYFHPFSEPEEPVFGYQPFIPHNGVKIRAYIATDAINALETPQSYEDALASKLAHKWKESMLNEYKQLCANNTWDYVRIDRVKRKPTKSKWAYRIKFNRDGTIDKFKSRFCVCGYSQVEGIDYDKAFSSTMRATSFRLLLALAAWHKLKLMHIDVSNAFTEADIDTDIWVMPPKGLETYDTDGTLMVLKLKKALYGTKQASRLWQETLRNFLKSHGFTPCLTDPCLYHYTGDEFKGSKFLIGIYVDDIVLAYSNREMYNWFLTKFCQPSGRFKTSEPTKLSWFLGMGIDQHDDFSVRVCQRKYIEDMVDKFLPGVKVHSIMRDTPGTVEQFNKLKPASSDEERERMRTKPFLQLLGSLLYAGTMSRADIQVYNSVLAKQMQDPSEEAYELALQVLLYLYKTRDLCLHYSGDCLVEENLLKEYEFNSGADAKATLERNYGLHAYSDSSWGDTHPVYGYVLRMAGGVISYCSKNLKSADSSAEAEYAAAAHAARELKFVRMLCSELGYEITGDVIMGVDNDAAIKVAQNAGVSQRNKHWDREAHYIRECVDHGYISLVFVRTAYQLADCLTKAMDKTGFLNNRKWLFRSA